MPGVPRTLQDLTETTVDLVTRVVAQFDEPTDELASTLLALPADGSSPRVADLPVHLLNDREDGLSRLAHLAIAPIVQEIGATMISFCMPARTVDFSGMTDAEINEAFRALMAGGVDEHSDLAELVVVVAVSGTDVCSRFARLRRTDDAVPQLGPWDDFGNVGNTFPGMSPEVIGGIPELVPLLQSILRVTNGRSVRIKPDADGHVVTIAAGAGQVKWTVRASEYPTVEQGQACHSAVSTLLEEAPDLAAWRLDHPTTPGASVMVVMGTRRYVDRALQLARRVEQGKPCPVDDDFVRLLVNRRLERLANTPDGERVLYRSS